MSEIPDEMADSDISEHSFEDGTQDSEWSSDDGSWNVSLAVIQNKMKIKRLESILKSDEWMDTESVDLQEIQRLSKENLFPNSPKDQMQSTLNYYADNEAGYNSNHSLERHLADDWVQTRCDQSGQHSDESQIDTIDSEEYQSSEDE